MPSQSLLLTALFALAAVAFIGVLNARGLWRTAVSAALALLCLVAALWHTADYRAARAAGMSTAPSAAASGPADGAAGGAPVASGRDGPSAARTDADMAADMADLLAAAGALRDSLAAEDPSRARALSDSAYEAFETRAADHLARARMLRERAARLAAAPPPGFEEGAEFLTLALQSLNAAARDLGAFFRANGREDEQRLLASFRQGVEAADAPLRRARNQAGRAGAPSTDFEP